MKAYRIETLSVRAYRSGKREGQLPTFRLPDDATIVGVRHYGIRGDAWVEYVVPVATKGKP